MGKVVVLLFLILLAFGSMAGYLILTTKINAGQRTLTEGQRQLEEGEFALKEGKAKLQAGKRELSEGKKEYEQAIDNPLLALADEVFTGGKGFEDARKQIAEGDKQVAKGEVMVSSGERRLEAGKIELSRGREQLSLAKGARIACALGAVFFVSLSIVLGFSWRRSIAGVFRRTNP
jgi:uncharacterized phage infection (PIP) family protein YhgE